MNGWIGVCMTGYILTLVAKEIVAIDTIEVLQVGRYLWMDTWIDT